MPGAPAGLGPPPDGVGVTMNRRARHAAGRGKPGSNPSLEGSALGMVEPSRWLPGRWTMAACVASGVLLTAGGSCALRGTVERPGVEMAEAWDPPHLAFEIIEGCKAAGYPGVRGEVKGGTFHLSCDEGLPSLGIYPVVARRPAR